jgi:WhiB family transcriptional regulator, redox-sensing transcriptional regulator
MSAALQERIDDRDAMAAWRGDPAAFVARGPEPDPINPLVAWLALLPAWHSDAACAAVHTSTFFPEKGGSTKPARAMCAGCPVREECLDEALADESLDHGIRAGLSASERQLLRMGQHMNTSTTDDDSITNPLQLQPPPEGMGHFFDTAGTAPTVAVLSATPPLTTSLCKHCEQLLPIDAFYPSDLSQHRCKACNNARPARVRAACIECGTTEGMDWWVGRYNSRGTHAARCHRCYLDKTAVRQRAAAARKRAAARAVQVAESAARRAAWDPAREMLIPQTAGEAERRRRESGGRS